MPSNLGINCGPAVRKISRELGIDLKEILGTGKDGLITKDDLKKHIASYEGATIYCLS